MEQSILYMREEGCDVEEIQAKIHKFALYLNDRAMQLLAANKHSLSLHILGKLEELLIKFNYRQLTQVLILTYSSLASVHRELGNFDTALNYLRKTTTLCEVCEEAEDAVATHLNVCTLFSQLGKHKRALDYAVKAVFTCQEKFPRENLSAKELTLLATAFYNMGIEEEFLNNTGAAKEWLKKAYELLENNSDVDPEIKIQLYKKLQSITERRNVEVIRLKKPKKRMCHCASQSIVGVHENARLKIVKLKPKANAVSPFAAQPRFIKRPIKRNASKKTALVSPLSSTLRERNTSKLQKPILSRSKASKEAAHPETNGKSSTTDYPSDLEGELNQLLMVSLNSHCANKVDEPPLNPLLDKMYPTPSQEVKEEIVKEDDQTDESDEEIKALKDLGVLEWSNEEESEDELKELCEKGNEDFKKMAAEAAKDISPSTKDESTSNKHDADLKALGDEGEKLFEGNMYLDGCNYLVRFFADEQGEVTVRVRNIATCETQSLVFPKEQAPNVLKANSKNMVGDSISALAQLLALKKSKGKTPKALEEEMVVNIPIRRKMNAATSKFNMNQADGLTKSGKGYKV